MVKEITISEGNYTIATFMGGKEEYPASAGWMKNIEGLPLHVSGRQEDGYCEIANMKYHQSWDWLMPVVVKIQSMRFSERNATLLESQEDSYGNHVLLHLYGRKSSWKAFYWLRYEQLKQEQDEEKKEAAKYGEELTHEHRIICSSKIEALWKAVVEFGIKQHEYEQRN